MRSIITAITTSIITTISNAARSIGAAIIRTFSIPASQIDSYVILPPF